jgi:hypothetical protein
MKRGPFAPSGFCCPADQHYYDPLRLPLGRPPLPGITGYRRASLPATPQATGPRRLSPVPRTTIRTFNAQYAGGFFSARSRIPGAFHGLRRARSGSAPPWPAERVRLTTLAQASLTLQTVRSLRPASHPASRPRTGASLPGGPGHLPGPDPHRQAALNLSLGYVMFDLLSSWRPSSLGALARSSSWHCSRDNRARPGACHLIVADRRAARSGRSGVATQTTSETGGTIVRCPARSRAPGPDCLLFR